MTAKPPLPMPKPLTRSLGMAGPYRLAMELAAGGMGVVYLAFQKLGGFRNVVAVKRIHAHLSRDRAFIDMFFDEAQIEARINHPYVCRVFNFGRDEHGHYIAMEFLRGEPLSRVFQALTPAKLAEPRHASVVMRIMANYAQGLHAAHTLKDIAGKPLNVVHRDVTPQNLFVLCDGTVRLTDFGVARARAQKHDTDGSLKGKLGYVSPEQLKHEALDGRTDIWALGVVAWELLTGRPLFETKGEGEAVLAVLKQPILPPSYFQSSVPAQADAIVLKALARDPAERYADGQRMARDIELFLRGSALNMDVAEWLEAHVPGVTERNQRLVENAQAWITTLDRQAASASESKAALSAKRRKNISRRRVVGVSALALFGLCNLGLFEEVRHAHAVPANSAAQSLRVPGSVLEAAGAKMDASPDSRVEPAVARFSRDGEYRVHAPPPPMSLARPSDPSALLETGSIRLETSNGRADVLLGDVALGTTPLTIDLPPGPHSLELKPLAGGALSIVNVAVTRGAEELVRVALPQVEVAAPTSGSATASAP